MIKKKRNMIIEFALIGILIVSVARWASAETNQPLVLTGGILIDGTGGAPVPDGVVVISDGRIAKVGSKTKVTVPTGSKVICLEGGTILPGFINTHVHRAYDEMLLQAWAQAGVMTVRDLAAYPPRSSFAIRDRLNRNPLNARLVAAGPQMTGGFVPSGYSSSVFIHTAEQARVEADRILNEGADQLKIMLESNGGNQVMPESAARALTETAHRRGKRVSAHISLSRDIKTALNVGVDDLAHMVLDKLPDELIEKVVKAGIFWIPTIEVWKGLKVDTHVLDNLGRFAGAGGKVALGTDFGGASFQFELGMPLKEMLWMREAGMSPSEIIIAATRNAADVCGLGQELGTLEPGKIAHVLVIDGNPLQDLANLTKVRLVIKGGKVIRQGKFNKSKLDDFFHQIEKNNKSMCGVVIMKNQELLYENYIGFSSIENETRNNNLTKFRIGSITKIFTATIIFQLIEEGQITLDTKLSTYYPQIPNSREITIADMLGHRSGIHNFTNDKEYLQYMTDKKSKEEMVDLIAKLKPDFQPNEKTAYSNSNYVLLGYIIEDITNSSYPQELEKRISAQLGLSNTYYGSKIDAKKNEAASYQFQQGKWKLQQETDMSIPHGAGAIVSTPYDLTVFIEALFNDKLISQHSLSQMKEMKGGIGKGMIRFPFGDRIAYGYNGGIDGFVSNLAFFPDENIAVSILSNGVNYNFNDLLIGILSIYFDVPFEMPDLTAKEIDLDIEELKKYEGEFSSKQLPLKITLKVRDNQLYGQATGQPMFPLTFFSRTEFRFEQAGIVISFTADDDGQIQYDSFILNQRGMKFTYKK